jgi:hypothetical protein
MRMRRSRRPIPGPVTGPTRGVTGRRAGAGAAGLMARTTGDLDAVDALRSGVFWPEVFRGLP